MSKAFISFRGIWLFNTRRIVAAIENDKQEINEYFYWLVFLALMFASHPKCDESISSSFWITSYAISIVGSTVLYILHSRKGKHNFILKMICLSLPATLYTLITLLILWLFLFVGQKTFGSALLPNEKMKIVNLFLSKIIYMLIVGKALLGQRIGTSEPVGKQ